MTAPVEERRRAHLDAQAAARSFRVSFRGGAWRGPAGNWAGTGVGSSIDFQDHRAYQPGDDPRYIDWNAYARTGDYTMKLYREEVSPSVDVVLDTSRSMRWDDGKRRRSLELLYFVIASARAGGAVLRCYRTEERAIGRLEPERAADVGADPFAAGAAATGLEQLARAVTRPGSLRILISDLLFPGSPDGLVRKLVQGRGRAFILVPWCRAEAAPDWDGNVDMHDCEGRTRRVERFDRKRLERYRAAYERHFALWEASCRRRSVALVRIPSAGDFAAVLKDRALHTGVVEPCP